MVSNVGICTHLGCVPLKIKVTTMVGFVHVMDHTMIHLEELEKDLHQTNLSIPNYEFLDSNTIKIG